MVSVEELFFAKVTGTKPATLVKRDSFTVFFQQFRLIFGDTF